MATPAIDIFDLRTASSETSANPAHGIIPAFSPPYRAALGRTPTWLTLIGLKPIFSPGEPGLNEKSN